MLLAVAWLAWTGLRAKAELGTVRDEVAAAQVSFTDGDAAAARTHLDAAAAAARAAHGHTDDALWHLAGHLPLVGHDLRTVSGLSGAVDDLARAGLPAIADAGQQLLGDDLRLADGTLDLSRVTATAAPLGRASASLVQARDLVAVLPAGRLGAVTTARTGLLARIEQLQGEVQRLQVAVDVAPGLLGADGPRTYFAGLQNPAEARGTGGLVGTFAVLGADRGAITLQKVGSDTDLQNHDGHPVADLGAAFDAQWRPFGADQVWPNVNVSPDVPSSASLMSALWKAQYGQQLDGVVLVDPVAAQYLLAATGPVTLPDGTVLDGTTLADYVTEGIYTRYATDNAARKDALEGVADLVFGRLTAGAGVKQSDLVRALVRGVSEGRVVLWSSHPAEQAQLATTTVAGALPSTPGPFAQVVVNNTAGNKLDAYLERKIDYVAGPCIAGRTRRSTITTTLLNTAPPGLPPYVSGRLDLPAGTSVPDGQQRLFVSVYAAVGATVTATTLDGRPLVVRTDTEAGHTVVGAYVELPVGTRRTVVVSLEEPAVGSFHGYRAQPLLRDAQVSASVATCTAA